MTKNEEKLIKVLIRNSNAMKGLEHALDKINDQNALHNGAFTQVVDKNTEALNAFCKSNKSSDRLFITIVLLLLVAVIILAGAKQAIELFLSLNIPFIQ
jgi:hypothetical protein